MGKYIQGADGNWYESTEGELNWIDGTTEDPRALTRTIETGNMVDDPSQKTTSYTVRGYNEDDLSGYRMSRSGRVDRRKAIKSLIGKRNEETIYEKYLGQGNLRRRDFRNQDFLNKLANTSYTGSDFEGLTTRGDFFAKRMADKVADIVYPTLRKKTSNGHFVEETKPVIGLRWHRAACPECGIGTSGLKRTVVGERTGRFWANPHYDYTGGSVNTNVSYGQMPETKDQYILPVQLIDKSSTETKTTTSTKPVAKPVVKPRKVTSTTTSPRPVVRKKVTPTPTSVDLQRTTTWQELPDGTRINVSVGDWASIK